MNYKLGKKRSLLRFSLAILLFLCINATVIVKSHSLLYAQVNTPGVELYPAYAQLEPGNSYELTISNKDAVPKAIEVYPYTFSIDSADSKIIPLEVIPAIQNIYIQISLNAFVLQPNESKKIEITYLDEFEGHLVGVIVVPDLGPKRNITIGSSLTSFILDLTLTEEEYDDLHTSIEVIPDFAFFDISLSNRYRIKTQVENKTRKLIRTTGEIAVQQGISRLGNISLTQVLGASAIYPENNVVIEKDYTDKRDLFKRVGRISFNQRVNINGRDVIVEKEMYAIPLEILVGSSSVLGVAVLGAVMVVRKRMG